MGEGFDAAFIAVGLTEPAGASKEKLDGLWSAGDFLTKAKQPVSLELGGKSVAVIGGGNTAMDVAVTAKQSGADDVYLIYRRSFKEMPAWQRERDRAMDRGIHFLILTHVLGFGSKDGKLTSIKLCPTRLGEPDKSGRRSPKPVESSAYELKMDVVVEAIGQQTPADIADILPGVEFADGLIETASDSLATSRPGVFAGGDIVRGPSTVVAAVADGMKAAQEIDSYLRK
jgi:glutamate synthase (NADPH/NADH) small chain